MRASGSQNGSHREPERNRERAKVSQSESRRAHKLRQWLKNATNVKRLAHKKMLKYALRAEKWLNVR